MIENLRSQYLSLGSRDRLAVGVLLVFFGILTFYFAIWQPLHDFKVSSQDELNRQSEMLQGMRETEKDARASSGNATNGTNGAIIVISGFSYGPAIWYQAQSIAARRQ